MAKKEVDPSQVVDVVEKMKENGLVDNLGLFIEAVLQHSSVDYCEKLGPVLIERCGEDAINRKEMFGLIRKKVLFYQIFVVHCLLYVILISGDGNGQGERWRGDT